MPSSLGEAKVSDQPESSVDRAIAFGAFRLFPAQELLLEGETPLRIGNRALEILKLLVERAGVLVTKDDLVARVWPNTIVEEGNLRVHMAALRRALGDGQAGNRFVATIPGRGYRFVAPVSVLTRPQSSSVQVVPLKSAHNLPVRLTRMVGRADIVGALVAQLPERRFVTIVGPGGIGKTTVGLAVAHELSTFYRDGIHFVDLAPVTDPLLVPSTLANVLGTAIRSEKPIPALVNALKDKQVLLLLDSCEHVIEPAADLAVEVLKGAPGVHILATSREPLRAEGERVQRLAPLGLPPESVRLTAAAALTFPAVQLFVERAAASLDGFELDDADAPAVADICRRLDGIALAIELAAGRVDAFGVRDLAARLNDRFRLLTRGRRTALPRHQTLSATLDWSYEFLPESERVTLRRLAVFAGSFTPEAAGAVAASAEIAASEVVDCVANLVAKSLVVADISGAIVRYRLLETMRAYALDKLADSGESNEVARRHAEYFRDLFQGAEAEWETRPTAEWLEDYGRKIDNVRAALDWAFSANGDITIGTELTVAAVPLWFQLSLLEECHGRVEQALARVGDDASLDKRHRMRLFAALGVALLHKIGPRPEIKAEWTTVLELAESLDDTDYKLRALWGLWVSSINGGEYRAALGFAERFRSLAATAADPAELLIGERLVGNSLYYLGDQTNARRHIERMLSRYTPPVHRSHVVRFHFEQRMAAHAILARILWEQGFSEQALRAAQISVADARRIDHALSLCIALAVGMCPVALAAGDLEQSEGAVAMLLDHSTEHALAYWHAWGEAFNGLLRIKRGDATGLQILGNALDEEFPGTSMARRHVTFLGEYAEALGRVGEIAKGFAAVDAAIDRCEREEGRWCFAELLRVKGELVLQEGASKASKAAEKYFLDSLGWARRQETLSWELRTAISLARLRRDQHRIEEAIDLLGSVYARFTEGFDTADLKTARALLDELA
jgi:predicted ATPase/DNA-binding winged helix-turn-helix (wHTH) protein